MDLDDQIPTQSNRIAQDSAVRLNRRKFSTPSDFVTLERGLTVRLSIFYFADRLEETGEHHINSSLIGYLKTLDKADVLSLNWTWDEFFSACSKTTPKGCSRHP